MEYGVHTIHHQQLKFLANRFSQIAHVIAEVILLWRLQKSRKWILGVLIRGVDK